MRFEEIYDTYSPKVFRLCMGYVNDTDIAKDITQDTFITVWQKLQTFKGESSVGTWIFRIASNKCLRQIEKEKKMPKGDMPMNLKATDNTDDNRKLDFLYKCISELPETDRLIISLELEEVDQSEIADIIGITPANVRVKIHRIKEKLSKQFSSHEQY